MWYNIYSFVLLKHAQSAVLRQKSWGASFTVAVGWVHQGHFRGELTMAASIRTIQLQIQCRARHSDVCSHLWERGFWLSWQPVASLLHSEAQEKSESRCIGQLPQCMHADSLQPNQNSASLRFLSFFLPFFCSFFISINPSFPATTMGKTNELPKDDRDKTEDLVNKTISKKFEEKGKAVDVVIWKRTKHKIIINCPQSGALCNMLPHGVRMIIWQVLDQPKTAWEELLNDLKATGTSVSKKHLW